MSPNNKWMAYFGQGGVWVARFPEASPSALIATGGTQPVWSRDGRELYFRVGSKMMALPIGTGDTLPAGRPVELFDYSGFLLSSPGYPTYDVTPDGRFVMIKAENEDASRNQINVVLNWAASLARPK
ncbi:MAG: Serine/threonine-protein kinase PknB [Acidobacteriota bacterium]